jgi:molecular chaperone GrpE
VSKKRPAQEDPADVPEADPLPVEIPPEEQPGLEAAPVEALRARLEEAKDRALRSQAELENYRKRAAREMAEQHRYANLLLMRDVLPVLDNMDRAIEAAEKTHDTSSLLEGVKMVARQLADVLEQHHCVRIDALNEPFDPHRHEAISQQPCDEHPVGTVLQVIQAGYQLHDRVVRPSQVIVSAAEPP